MAETRQIALADLSVDPRNPRLEEGLTSQLDALHSMLRHLGRKILTLATDIVHNGVNPTERLIVMLDPEDSQRYTVLEGNRRVTALKVLEAPGLADGYVTKGVLEKLQALSRQYSARPVQLLDCWVVERREDAAHWMTLRHESGHEGAGVLQWSAMDQARFASWRGGAPTAALQLVNLVLEHGGLDDATREKVRDVPTSSFMRVVQTPDAAKRLGVQYNRKTRELQTLYPESEVAKGFTRLLTDLAAERINSRALNKAADIMRYVGGFDGQDLPAKANRLPSARPLSVSTPAPTAPSRDGRARARGRPGGPRACLVPKTFRIAITNPRLDDVRRELQSLKLDDHPNAIAVLFRVFVELTVDHYLESKSLKTEQELDGMKLRDKLTSAANDLKTKKLINRQQHDAVRRAAQDQLYLATGLLTFHSYVHNRYVLPKAGELRAAWDELQPFLEAAWT